MGSFNRHSQITFATKSRRFNNCPARNIPFVSSVNETTILDRIEHRSIAWLGGERYRARSQWTEPDDFIFTARRGIPMNANNYLRRVFKSVAKPLKVDCITFQRSRRTAQPTSSSTAATSKMCRPTSATPRLPQPWASIPRKFPKA